MKQQKKKLSASSEDQASCVVEQVHNSSTDATLSGPRLIRAGDPRKEVSKI